MSSTETTDEQLVHQVLQAERDFVAARFRHSMNQLENTASLGVLRRQIARLRTEARGRELQNGLTKGSLLLMHRATFGADGGEAEQAPAEKGGFLSGIVDKLTASD